MEILNHTDILMIVLAVIATALFGLHYRQSQHIRVLQSLLAGYDEHNGSLDNDLAALLKCSRRIGDRLSATERAQRTMQKQIDNVQLGDESGLAIRHATKLLANGSDLKEVTNICELTQGEVEILQNLSRHSKAA